MLGLVEVGTGSVDTYDSFAVLSIDCGGDDTYTGGAGGASTVGLKSGLCLEGQVSCGISIVLDVSGDDDYKPVGADGFRKPVIGSADVAIGALFDLAGNDEYVASKWIASSVAGVGLLIDHGGGDIYDSTGLVLGDTPTIGTGSTAGTGFLVDLGTEGDVYKASGADAMGHGGAAARSFLLDAGGNDEYLIKPGPLSDGDHAGPGLGTGEAGGLGILLDAGGNDQYKCDAPQNYLCQGGGKLAGIGLLLDLVGDDTRTLSILFARGNAVREAAGLGAADLGGVGIAYDLAGGDSYNIYEQGGGFSLCAGIGLLLDLGGVDSYQSTDGRSYGYGKTYCLTDQSAGEIILHGLGVFYDAAGSDTYGVPGASYCGTRGNNAGWRDGMSHGDFRPVGVGVDEVPLGLC